jgi:hypothetical protein
MQVEGHSKEKSAKLGGSIYLMLLPGVFACVWYRELGRLKMGTFGETVEISLLGVFT